MDDATTVFATACAVIAASTGMVLCFAPKNVNDAVVDEEPIAASADKVDVVEETLVTSEEIVKEEAATESERKEEPITSDEHANDRTELTDAVPEQRPPDVDVSTKSAETAPAMKAKRRFTMRSARSQRNVEVQSMTKPMFKKSQSMKWLPFRSGSNKKSAADPVNVGPEI